jgi:hypothetical protein
VLSFSSGKYQSTELAFYQTAQKFWKNLGIPYFELKNMAHSEFQILEGIMNIEAQYQETELKQIRARK